MQRDKMIIEPGETFSIEKVPALMDEIKNLKKNQPLEIDFKNTKTFDSAGIAFVNHLKGIRPDVVFKNLDPEFDKIFSMFPAGEESKTGRKTHKTARLRIRQVTHSMGHGMETLDDKYLSFKKNLKTFFVLLADEIFYTFQYLFKRRGIYPGEIGNQLFYMAYKSYPIVSLISFLVGVTVALTSAEQLRNFGADIYLADLVGFGMIRELVPLMTGIILAGKIGASITAEVSSMKVMEETDALKTMGIVPEKFLMVPRLIAITLAIPLLVAIADFVGIMGGLLVGKFFSGIPAVVFYNEMLSVVELSDFLIGLGKTVVFGWIVVVSSGFKGFSVTRGAAGVGIATTESVVLSISLIIIFDCFFALISY
ncbi:MAG: ABC transporter permease [bacterium]|nr:ABC transporter permease [bacterium]